MVWYFGLLAGVFHISFDHNLRVFMIHRTQKAFDTGYHRPGILSNASTLFSQSPRW